MAVPSGTSPRPVRRRGRSQAVRTGAIPMRRTRLALAILASAAATTVATLTLSPSYAQQGNRAAEAAPAGRGPVTQPTQVPVKQVVLFSSGVGYFEHFGSVKGNGSTE